MTAPSKFHLEGKPEAVVDDLASLFEECENQACLDGVVGGRLTDKVRDALVQVDRALKEKGATPVSITLNEVIYTREDVNK